MARHPASLSFVVTARSAWHVGRRDFLKQCGFVAITAGALSLAGCGSARETEQAEPPPTSGFFVDGTDFAD